MKEGRKEIIQVAWAKLQLLLQLLVSMCNNSQHVCLQNKNNKHDEREELAHNVI